MKWLSSNQEKMVNHLSGWKEEMSAFGDSVNNIIYFVEISVDNNNYICQIEDLFSNRD